MAVPVKKFRNSVDHLFRLINSDYHSCVGAQELRSWFDRAETLLKQVQALECKRASEYDRQLHTKCLSDTRNRLFQAATKIERLENTHIQLVN